MLVEAKEMKGAGCLMDDDLISSFMVSLDKQIRDIEKAKVSVNKVIGGHKLK